ncbi:ATPase, T2SS/T4P/T4SS family [Pseudomonas sp. zfem004]|uniref:ATPase, T2SS/T4P/T4SS family n=1 Tax=Pseudomonas sp. zfem004 TaxID=3078199 RepID=UPI0029287B1E|nr:ATPase, T2SS/T4P/T4SS family [Pseudomonas sp. zfem004]MDU9404910.1 ATPase, T2SS/T4P/T4SS family [Pseudomonas sp. zfem004]
MSLIADADFVDLYLGHDFADVKGLAGQPRKAAVPSEWQTEIEDLRRQCLHQFETTREPEFALVLEERVLLRVTYILDVFTKPFFVLNRSRATIIPLEDLGLPDHIYECLLAEETRGLVYFAGEMGTGKTSSAASAVKARLTSRGGLGLTVEDPPETLLQGEHGAGRCIQLPVSRVQGGYSETLIRALRTRADLILVGEVRDAATAAEVIKASINGHLIFSTGHGGSIGSAIQRLAVLAEPIMPNAMEVLSQGLTAVIHQTLLRPDHAQPRLTLQTLLLTQDDAPSIREKLRSGHLQMLEQDIVTQSNRSLWHGQ